MLSCSTKTVYKDEVIWFECGEVYALSTLLKFFWNDRKPPPSTGVHPGDIGITRKNSIVTPTLVKKLFEPRHEVHPEQYLDPGQDSDEGGQDFEISKIWFSFVEKVWHRGKRDQKSGFLEWRVLSMTALLSYLQDDSSQPLFCTQMERQHWSKCEWWPLIITIIWIQISYNFSRNKWKD